jgi:dihydroorotate dehydrogenase
LRARGFGFLEVGRRRRARSPAIRARACSGCPRTARDQPLRLQQRRRGGDRGTAGARPGGAVVGLNLGANKDSDDRAADFAAVLAICGPHVDFATVNVSSPNTERLRDLQGSAALAALLARVMEAFAPPCLEGCRSSSRSRPI